MTPIPLDLSSPAIPPEVGEIVKLLIEGRITDLVIIACTTDGSHTDGLFSGIGDGPSNSVTMIGALELAKRDWMRIHIESRVEYLEVMPEGYDTTEED